MVAFNEYGILPEGIHQFNVTEFEKTFGFTAKRREMIEKGLKPVLTKLEIFNVKEIYIDGSFVTITENPDDIDGYTRTNLGSELHTFIVDHHDDWQLYHRVDFYAALTDIEGETSTEWFQDHFSTVSNLPSQRKGYVALTICESGRA